MAKYAGFDTSVCPSSEESAKLKGYGLGYSPTPLWFMGFYLGGCCANVSGYGPTAYNYLTKQGWNLYPIWVSVQNTPCDSSSGVDLCPLPSSSTGISSAKSAASKALDVGFPAGTVIYLDCEVSGDLTSAYLDFITAWVKEIQDSTGYYAGIYTGPGWAPTIQQALSDAGAGAVMWNIARYPCNPGQFEDWSTGACETSSCSVVANPDGEAPEPSSGSRFADASTWQYAGDVYVSYHGVYYDVDLSVSEFSDPGLLRAIIAVSGSRIGREVLFRNVPSSTIVKIRSDSKCGLRPLLSRAAHGH